MRNQDLPDMWNDCDRSIIFRMRIDKQVVQASLEYEERFVKFPDVEWLVDGYHGNIGAYASCCAGLWIRIFLQ